MCGLLEHKAEKVVTRPRRKSSLSLVLEALYLGCKAMAR